MPVLQITGGRDHRLSPLDAALITAIHRGPVCPLYADLLTRAARCIGCDIAPATALYEGGATGADTDSRHVAERSGLPFLTFEADWRPGDGPVDRSAGPRRNSDMLAGRHPCGEVEPPAMVLAFPGGVGTADMVAKAHKAGLPVLDLGGVHRSEFAPFQRWTKDDTWVVLHGGAKGVAGVRALRPGAGLPIMSGHHLKVNGRPVIPEWCEYIGRDAHGLAGHPLFANPFPVKPLGKDKPDRVAVCVAGAWNEMHVDEALEPFERHLRHLAARPDVRAALAQLHAAGKVLVCWCDSRKPCHACVVARAALMTAAAAANRQVWASAVGSAHAAAVQGPEADQPLLPPPGP